MAKETIKDIQKRLDLLYDEASVQRGIFENDNKRTDALKKSKKALEEILKVEKLLVIETRHTTDEGKESISLAKKANDLARKKSKLSERITLAGKDNAKSISRSLKQEAAFSELIGEQILQKDAMTARNEMSEHQMEDIRNLSQEHLNLLDEMGSGMLEASALEDKLLQVQQERQQIVATIGKDGEEYYKGLEESLKDRIKMSKAEALSGKAMEGLDELIGGMGSQLMSVKDTFNSLGPTVGGLSLAMMAVVAILVSFNGKLDAIGGQFGAIGLQSTELRDDLLASSAEAAKLGKDFEDIVESITTLTSEFGVGFKEARSMANEVISVSMGLGLSTSEGGQLIGVLSTIGGLSNDTAIALAQQTTLLAKSSDVAPQQVLQDIAGSSEVVAKFTDASGKNILRGAIQARKLGTNLETAASAAESMLDFQTAIENAMTASVMVGRQINIQKLQELSLAGDLEGVSKEQRRLLGDQESFLSMNVLQREALAKAVGLSVDQAAKMLDKEEDAITLAGELAQQKGFEELVGSEAISQMAEMMGMLKSTAAILVNVLGPPLNFIMTIFSETAKIINFVTGGLAGMVGPMGMVAIAAAAMGKKMLWSAITGIWSGLKWLWAIPVVGPPLAIATALGATSAIFKSLAGAKSATPMAAGGIVTQPTNALVGEAGAEAVIPISKLADFMADAMAPVVSSIDKLNEDFTKKHVPALALSNESGGKKAGREIGRQFQMNAA